jgi:hypothetical protein
MPEVSIVVVAQPASTSAKDAQIKVRKKLGLDRYFCLSHILYSH